MTNERTLDDIWPNLSKDIEKIKLNSEKRSQWGYNNLYCRSFVNKLISLENIFTEDISISFLLSLLKLKGPESGYYTMTTIKSFIVLKHKFDYMLVNPFRECLIKKIDTYENCLKADFRDRMRFRPLQSLLESFRSQI